MFQRSSPLKEKLGGALGAAGYAIYYLVSLLITTLPFVFIGLNVHWAVLILIIAVYLFIPIAPVELALWIWGLVGAIDADAGFFSVLYYIVFAIKCIPILIAIVAGIASLFQKDNM